MRRFALLTLAALCAMALGGIGPLTAGPVQGRHIAIGTMQMRGKTLRSWREGVDIFALKCPSGMVPGATGCGCPAGDQIYRTGDGAVRCITPPPETCSGDPNATVVAGKCVCPGGDESYRTGNGVVRCITPPPETCSGDPNATVVAGKCVCPGGDESYRTGNGVVRCITPPPETCTGDPNATVVAGKCICPAGDQSYRSRDGVVRCIPPPANALSTDRKVLEH